MLRIIVISLFVANLLLLGFQSSQPEVKKKVLPDRSVTDTSNIPTIYLFSELAQDQSLLTHGRQCFTLGPFHSIEDMSEVQTSLMLVSADIRQRQSKAFVEKGYWVFLPPYESLLKANEELFSLQALGLKDVAVIYEGELKRAISLGYFLRQKNAIRRKQGLEAKGYEPLMQVQRQMELRFWLDYEQTPGADLLTLNMQNRPNDFMQRSLPCPEPIVRAEIAMPSAQPTPGDEPLPQQ